MNTEKITKDLETFLSELADASNTNPDYHRKSEFALISGRVEQLLKDIDTYLNNNLCIQCSKPLPDSETGYCYECNEHLPNALQVTEKDIKDVLTR